MLNMEPKNLESSQGSKHPQVVSNTHPNHKLLEDEKYSLDALFSRSGDSLDAFLARDLTKYIDDLNISEIDPCHPDWSLDGLRDQPEEGQGRANSDFEFARKPADSQLLRSRGCLEVPAASNPVSTLAMHSKGDSVYAEEISQQDECYKNAAMISSGIPFASETPSSVTREIQDSYDMEDIEPIPIAVQRKTSWSKFYKLLPPIPPREVFMAKDMPGTTEDEAVPSADETSSSSTSTQNFRPLSVSSPSTTKKIKTVSRKSKRVVKFKKNLYIQPTDLDVKCGRGGEGNNHPGNKKYHEFKARLKPFYMAETQNGKTEISKQLLASIHSQGGRFIRKEEGTELWYEISDKEARKKCGQALREKYDTPAKREIKRSLYPSYMSKKGQPKQDMELEENTKQWL